MGIAVTISSVSHCLKITQNVAFEFLNFGIKSDLSGNTVWPQASDFQKLAKMYHFVHSKLKRSSLCWWLFWQFSNTVRDRKDSTLLFPMQHMSWCFHVFILMCTTAEELSEISFFWNVYYYWALIQQYILHPYTFYRPENIHDKLARAFVLKNGG